MYKSPDATSVAHGTVMAAIPSSKPTKGAKAEDHDGVVECDLRQRETTLTFCQATPNEDHGRAGCSGEQNQPGNVAIDLVGGK
jgi:hypothetical protein